MTLQEEANQRGIIPPSRGTLNRYGLTAESWCWILKSQGWKCPICGKDGGIWNVDHFHHPGWARLDPEERVQYVRGILCAMCNYRSAPSRMTSERARNLAKYLSTYESRMRTGSNLGQLCECHNVPMQKSGTGKWRCAVKRSEWNKRRRKSLVDRSWAAINEEKEIRGGCEYPGCKWDGPLEWHHRDPSTKKYNIGESGGQIRSLQAIRDEMSKCDLLCPNHHSVADEKRRDS